MTEYVKVKAEKTHFQGVVIQSSYEGEVGEIMGRKLSLNAGDVIVRLRGNRDIVLSKRDLVPITKKAFFAERLRGN